MEVMGLMLGEFVDEYTVQVIDVFAMPQSGTTVSVESVDHVFQQRMVDMLKQTGRSVAALCASSSKGLTSMHLSALRRSWDGITLTQDSGAGYRASISTLSRCVHHVRRL